jgi:hypothetical protein
MPPELTALDRIAAAGLWEACMAEYVPASSTGTAQELAERATQLFSATLLIGGRLRALYNDAEQPSPSRLTDLLRTLDDGKTCGSQ